MSSKDKDLDPAALPQKEAFESKEVFQHKQPADAGVPLEDETSNAVDANHLKEAEKSSKEEGLNQEKSPGEAGAFEGFENPQNN